MTSLRGDSSMQLVLEYKRVLLVEEWQLSFLLLSSSKTLNKIEKHPLMEHHFCLGTPSFYSFFTGPACGITDLACPFDPQTTQKNM
jgi:hypothetical protein